MIDNKCAIVTDLLELYKEGNVSEETKSFIERHLKDCNMCFEIYCQNNYNIFNEMDDEEIKNPGNRKFVTKLKKTFTGIMVAVLALVALTGAVTFAIGHITGSYGTRFKLAEEMDLFINVNEAKHFGENLIELEKVLLDSTVTSIILKTELDLNKIDSITLSDDSGNYYTKTHSLFNGILKNYSKVNGYTVMNFAPVSKNSSSLKLELINWKNSDNEVLHEVIFNIPVDPNKVLKDTEVLTDVASYEQGGIIFNVDKVTKNISQTVFEWSFNNKDSAYDGVSLGWYYDEIMNNSEKILFTKINGERIDVLSTECNLHEKLIDGLGQNMNTHRIITNPLSAETKSIKLEINDLYGFVNLENREISVDTEKSSVIDSWIYTPFYDLYIKDYQVKDSKLTLNYQSRNKDGQWLNMALDARIRSHEDIYAVPVQGIWNGGSELSSITFDIGNDKRYVIYLSRLGEVIDFGEMDINFGG